MKKIKILLIDDHALFRSGLRMILMANMPEVEVCHEASTLAEALKDAAAPPDVILLDIFLPGLSGMEGIELLKRRWPSALILVLSSQDEQQAAQMALARGAAGFLSKANTADCIVALIRKGLEGGADGAPDRSGRSEPHVAGLLTPRQLEVLELLCRGLPNKLIARELKLAENTVRVHVQAILRILQVTNRSEAICVARKQGLVNW